MASKATIAVGVGAGLVGAFFLFREIQKYQARKKLEQLTQDAIAGKISPRAVLDAIASGVAAPPPGTPKITVAEAKALPCEVVFPSSVFSTDLLGAALPGFLAAQRQAGKCL